jgi:hypothetical protein
VTARSFPTLPDWLAAAPARRDVLLIVPPGVAVWDDLPLLQAASRTALDHDVEVLVVTPDPVASSLATAVGLRVVSRLPDGWGADAELLLVLDTSRSAASEWPVPVTSPVGPVRENAAEPKEGMP